MKTKRERNEKKSQKAMRKLVMNNRQIRVNTSLMIGVGIIVLLILVAVVYFLDFEVQNQETSSNIEDMEMLDTNLGEFLVDIDKININLFIFMQEMRFPFNKRGLELPDLVVYENTPVILEDNNDVLMFYENYYMFRVPCEECFYDEAVNDFILFVYLQPRQRNRRYISFVILFEYGQNHWLIEFEEEIVPMSQ